MGSTISVTKAISLLSIGTRTLIVAAGAFAMMYVISYPSVFVGPDASIPLPFFSEEFLTEWRNWLWVAPWLMMELASIIGKKRNLVFFSGLLIVMACTMIVYPILQATQPELIDSTLRDRSIHGLFIKEHDEDIIIFSQGTPYRDGCLSFGFIFLWVLLGLSAFIRIILIGYINCLHRQEETHEANSVEVADISPNAPTAKTVREIVSSHKQTKPDFKYGEADFSLITHLKNLFKHIQLMRNMRGLAWLALVCLLFLWFFLYPQPSPQEALQRDLERMYETRTDADGNEIATTRAVYAALRVMRHLSAPENKSLHRMTITKAEDWLQMHRASDAYRARIRDERFDEKARVPERLKGNSVTFAKFLTITDGKHTAAMVLCTDADKDARPLPQDAVIFYPQYYENGWDDKADRYRAGYFITILNVSTQ